MNDHTVTEIDRLKVSKRALKKRVKSLQELAVTHLEIIKILKRRIKHKNDLADLKNESIEGLIHKQRKILKQLNQLEVENTGLRTRNQLLERTTCCHRNEY